MQFYVKYLVNRGLVSKETVLLRRCEGVRHENSSKQAAEEGLTRNVSF